jgi:hypothetical protein
MEDPNRLDSGAYANPDEPNTEAEPGQRGTCELFCVEWRRNLEVLPSPSTCHSATELRPRIHPHQEARQNTLQEYWDTPKSPS